MKTHQLRDWQAALYDELKHEPNDRAIHFIIDIEGNKGKSWFAKYYRSLHPNKTQILTPGKKADMAYMLEKNKRVIFFDCPRSKQGDFIQYDFLEALKNGMVMSSKYESEMKEFDPPHVVVLMNEHPDESKLSSDRIIKKVI